MLREQWATLIFLIALFPSAGGGLAEPPTLRASDEHCFIVRVLRAQGAHQATPLALDCPFPRLL